MGKLIVDITMSLDGFVAGLDINTKQPMGIGGLRLHNWIFNAKTDADTQLLQEITAGTGAVIIGGRTYLTAIDEAWGGQSPFEAPAFVLLKERPTASIKGFTYVTNGIESAVSQATAVAGDKNIWVMGGATTIQQFLKVGLIDELHIHIADVLLGAGTRLFDHLSSEHIELERIRVIQTPAATHLSFRVAR